MKPSYEITLHSGMSLDELAFRIGQLPDQATTDAWIDKMTDGKAHVTECQCDECKAACSRIPCLCTPQDVARLIERGYFEKLTLSDWCAGAEFGIPPIPTIQICAMGDERAAEQSNLLDFLAAHLGMMGGQCPMWDPKTGLCTIHEYKPTEGKMGNCHDSEAMPAHRSTTAAVAMSWLLPSNRKLVRSLFEQFNEKPYPYWPKEEATHIPAPFFLP